MCIIYKLENYKLQITNYKHWKAEFQPSLFSYFAVPAPAPLFLGFLPFLIAIF